MFKRKIKIIFCILIICIVSVSCTNATKNTDKNNKKECEERKEDIKTLSGTIYEIKNDIVAVDTGENIYGFSLKEINAYLKSGMVEVNNNIEIKYLGELNELYPIQDVKLCEVRCHE